MKNSFDLVIAVCFYRLYALVQPLSGMAVGPTMLKSRFMLYVTKPHE
jgi:hypothetical protein